MLDNIEPNGLDNIGDTHQANQQILKMKRHIKQVEDISTMRARNLRKSNKLLSQIIPLGRQALKQLSPAQDDLKADLHLLFEEGETHLRNQGHAVN